MTFLLFATACGKKGPPLAPFVRIPVAPEITAARRVGSGISVSVKVPTTNVDTSKPASLHHIEVHAVTALTPPGTQFFAMATVVATIPVAREADPSDRSGTVVADPATGALQGSTVTILDSLTSAAMVPKEPPAPQSRPPVTPTAGADDKAPQVLRRFYLAIAFNDRKQPSPLSKVIEVPLTPLPEKIRRVNVSLRGNDLVLEWEPSGGLVGWLLERKLPPEVSPVDEPATTPAANTPSADLPPGPTVYNVYRQVAPDPLALPDSAAAAPWTSAPADPINMAPLSMLTFPEEVAFDGRRRCYQVRAVRGTGAQRVESEASEPECIVPVDIEPPTAPTGLGARVVDGEIRLSWEPNGEADLGGYIVLRGEAGDDTLTRLTPSGPISDTRFNDNTVMPGRMYRYVVQAVDNRIPLPNLSDPAEVTETAR